MLRYFLVVAEELHMGRAAERLHMTQQPLSVAIRRLEDAIGVELFVREANRIRLSAAGEALVPGAQDLLRRADVAAESARRASRGDAGTLRIGYCSAAMRSTIPAISASYRARYPHVVLDLAQLTQRDQLARLERGELDVAFVHRPIDERGRTLVDVVDDYLVIVMPASHRLAKRESVTPAEVAGEIGAAFRSDEYGDFLALANAAFTDCEWPPQPTTFARDRASLVGLVAGGAGFAVLSETSAHAEARPDIAIIPLETPIRLSFVAVWNDRAGDQPLLRRFRDTLINIATPVRPVSAA